MGKDFKEEEERLRFLISKVDSEILRFSEIKQKMEERQEDFNRSLRIEGMQPVPVIFQPSSSSKDLLDELTEHILELNKLKNLVAQKLNLVIKEEELFQKIRQKHGSDVELRKLPAGDFEIVVNDAQTQQAFSQMQASRKNLAGLKKTIQELSTG